MIKYYKHHQIDHSRWDNVIMNSQNGLVYALSWYLDIVSPGWEALIEGDYDYIMPLPVKHKYFIPYLVQPVFTQQLGIFSALPTDILKVKEFLKAIPKNFLVYHFNLNKQNPVVPSKHLNLSTNYELLLSNSYEELWKNFNENTRRNIKKAHQQNLNLTNCNKIEFIKNCKLEKGQVPSKVFDLLLDNLLESVLQKNICEIYTVKNQNGDILAGSAFIKKLNRIIYLVSFSNNEGKNASAMFLIIENIIQKYAGSGIILDFEGSTIPGIARFFEGFGAKKLSYPKIRANFIWFRQISG
jgi:hypothetical protein